MHIKKIKVPFLTCSTALLLLALAGCHKDPAEAVRQRAGERWDLLASHQAVKAYDYLSPGYRSTHTLEQYIAFVATASVRWKSAKVDSVQCEDEVCKVKLTVISIIPGSAVKRPTDLEFSSPVEEKWISGEGQWYLLPDSRIKPGAIAQEAVQIPEAPAKAGEGAAPARPEKAAGDEKPAAPPPKPAAADDMPQKKQP